MAEYIIRPAQREDCGGIAGLIKELAEFEDMSDRVTITESGLKEDGFGKTPYFECLVAEVQGPGGPELVAYGLYFFTYSSFQGRSLYMEDLYVKPHFRSRGIGTAMWRHIAQIAVQKECKRLDFEALSWNKKAISLYEKLGAVNITTTDDWHHFRVTGHALKALATTD